MNQFQQLKDPMRVNGVGYLLTISIACICASPPVVFGMHIIESPYIGFGVGIASQAIQDVNFDNPRNPEFTQGSHDSAVPLGSVALGSSLQAIPLRLELRGTFRGKSNFNRDYWLPSLAVVGIQKIRVQSNTLMIQGYYDVPLQAITPYVTAGVGASWNKTTATQYAPQLPGWIYNFIGTTQNNFTWVVGVGLSKSMTNNSILDVGFNYASLGKFDTGVLPRTGDEHIFGKLYASELFVGFHYYV